MDGAKARTVVVVTLGQHGGQPRRPCAQRTTIALGFGLRPAFGADLWHAVLPPYYPQACAVRQDRGSVRQRRPARGGLGVYRPGPPQAHDATHRQRFAGRGGSRAAPGVPSCVGTPLFSWRVSAAQGRLARRRSRRTRALGGQKLQKWRLQVTTAPRHAAADNQSVHKQNAVNLCTC